MTLETLTQLFAWMTAINLGLLIAATLLTMLVRNRATAFHATLFDLDQADIRLTFYRFPSASTNWASSFSTWCHTSHSGSCNDPAYQRRAPLDCLFTALIDINLAQAQCQRARCAAADLDSVNGHNGLHECCGRSDKGFVGFLSLGNGKGAFLDNHLCLFGEFEYHRAGNAVKDVVGQLPRDDPAVFDDIGVV